MLRMVGDTERIVAVLHDVVEDSTVTLDDLREADFSDEVIKAVEALTKRPGETRLQAAQRAACHPIACAVKLADNADNMDLSRIASPTDKDHARLAQYRAVRELLLAAQSNHHSPA
jgi:(p)ppGpp synthase/HD superfamily hydrolase